MTERPRDSSAAAAQLRLRRVGGMFTTMKVRKHQKAGDYIDPGWYAQPPGIQAFEWAAANSAALPEPARAAPVGQPRSAPELKVRKPTGHGGH